MKQVEYRWNRVVAAVFLAVLIVSGQSFANTIYVARTGGIMTPTDYAVIDPSTGAVTEIPIGTFAQDVVITPDGRSAYLALTATNQVIEVDTSTNAVVSTIPVPMGPVLFAMTPDGQYIYVTTNSSDINVIETSSNAIVATITLPPFMGNPAAPAGIDVTPDGSLVYVNDNNNSFVYVIDALVNAVVVGPGLPISDASFNSNFGLGITPDGQFVYVLNQGSLVVSIIKVSSNTVVNTIPIPNAPIFIAFNPQSPFAYVTSSPAATVSVINTDTQAVVQMINTPVMSRPQGIAVTADGTLGYVADYGLGVVYTLDLTTNTLLPGSFPVGFNAYALAIVNPSPPSGTLQGEQRKNDFGLIFERFNQLNWEASRFAVDGYFVYRNGTKIAVLSPSTLQYQDHDIAKGVTTHYSVTSFDSIGNESTPISVTIN